MRMDDSGQAKPANNNQKALKSGLWYTVSNFLTKGIVFLTTPIFTRIMSKAAYGEYSSFITWQSLLLLVLPLALYSTVNRARFDFPDKMDDYLTSITLAGSVVTAIAYTIVLVFMDQFEAFFGMSRFYISIMFLFVLLEPALANFQSLMQARYQYRVVTVISLCSCVISVGMSIAGSFLFEDQMLGRVLGYDLSLVLFYICVYVWILYHGRHPRRAHISYALKLSVPLVPHLVSMYILGQCDKLVIQRLIGNEAVANYNIGYTCALVISMLSNSVNGAMSPWLFEKLSQKDYGTIKKVNQYYILIFTFVAFGLMLVSPEIQWILGGNEYKDSRSILMPVMAGCCCNFIYTSYVNVENYLKKPGVISIGTSCVAVLNIVLNFIYVEKFGYKAAAYTTLLSYFILLLYHYSMVKKFGYSHIYNNKLNLGCAIGICLFSIFFVFVFETVIRWVLIAAYVVIGGVIIKRNYQSIRTIVFSITKTRDEG